jgi:hypothetical protein
MIFHAQSLNLSEAPTTRAESEAIGNPRMTAV